MHFIVAINSSYLLYLYLYQSLFRTYVDNEYCMTLLYRRAFKTGEAIF